MSKSKLLSIEIQMKQSQNADKSIDTHMNEQQQQKKMGHFVCKINIENALISPVELYVMYVMRHSQTTSYQMYHKLNKMPFFFSVINL